MTQTKPVTPAPKQKPKAKPKAQAKTQTKAEPKAQATLSPASKGKAIEIRYDALRRSDLNYRKTFTQAELDELAASIAARGLLQSLLVRPHPTEAGAYEIAAGERRWRAMAVMIANGDMAEASLVPCQVRDMSDLDMLENAVTENAQRENVPYLEEAEAYARLQDMRAAAGGDTSQISQEIANKIGCSQRRVQRRIKMARNLCPALRKAIDSGKVSSFAMAELLAQQPHKIQTDALKVLGNHWNGFSDAPSLKRWLDRAAPPVGKQPWSLAVYDGELIGGDIEGEPQRFADKGLAQRLTEHWCQAKFTDLASQRGYKGKAYIEAQYNEYWFPKVKKGEDIPAEFIGVHFALDRDTLKTSVTHPVYDRNAWHDHQEKAKGAAGAIKTDTGDRKASEIAAPLAKRHWKAGAAARTKAVREGIAKNPGAAMAAAIIATLPRATGAYYRTSLLRINRDHPSGDARDIPEGGALQAMLAANPIKGINKQGELTDAKAATLDLLARKDLSALFCARIADLSRDADYEAKPGCNDEAIALHEAGFVAAPTGEIVNEVWLKSYTAPQLRMIAKSTGINFTNDERPDQMKKGQLVSVIAEEWNPKTTPLEAQFLDAKTAEKSMIKMLKGQKL